MINGVVIASWVGIAIVILLNVIGWIIGYTKYSKNEASHLGALGEKVDGLDKRIDSLEKHFEQRMDNLEKRLDGMFSKRRGID